ncbi:MAG: trypsin-like peptidase domain-containing protein [Planctomycetaceae bacterium]|nr:trypsin-like peptidase domain-containing protein [Planctomycetaceae bacterium]
MVCSAAFSADPPSPYVAVRVDYFRGDPVPAAGTDTTKIGEQRGSGVVVGEANSGTWYVLTNAHVIDAGEDIKRAEPSVFAAGEWQKGRVIAADDESDLALVRIRSASALQAVKVSQAKPPNAAKVATHGLIGGRTYCLRPTELRHALPLADGALAWAPQRFYVRTTFRSGESGGAVTFEDRLVGLIYGNDPAAGWGLVVDHASIVRFLKPFLTEAASGG